MSLFDYIFNLGHYDFTKLMIPKSRGKGRNKNPHKNNYKQKIKRNRGKRR